MGRVKKKEEDEEEIQYRSRQILRAGRGMIARPFSTLPYNLTRKTSSSYFLPFDINIFCLLVRCIRIAFIIIEWTNDKDLNQGSFLAHAWLSYLMKVDKRVICQRSKVVNRTSKDLDQNSIDTSPDFFL